MTAKQITLLISIIYFIIGNIAGYEIYKGGISSDGATFFLFIPYTFTWTLSSLVGADWLTYLFIIIAFLITMVVFFPIGNYLGKPSDKK